MYCVLLHGLGQTPASWAPVIDRLDRGSEAVCPDLSRWLDGNTPCYSTLYEALKEYCDRLEGPLHLCGLSLCGILALDYGLHHPQRMCSLTLIGAQYKMPKGLLKFQNVLFRLMPASAFRDTGLGKEEMIRLSASMLKLNFQEDLRHIRCPVLVVCGEKDGANRAASRALGRQIPGAKLVELPGAGHEVNRDAPEALAETLNAFLSGVEGVFPSREG